MQLPLFVNKKNKYFAGFLMYGLGYSLYYLTNHYPLSEPIQLPMTFIDHDTPFLPFTVVIYVSEYLYFALVYILLENYENISQYLYSFFSLQLLSCFIFLIFPTIYPRERFPIPTTEPEWIQSLWTWLRHQDAATNCFPSLHVSSVYLSALVFLKDGTHGSLRINKLKYWAFMIWGTLIALSTLTTKQHYLADILCGTALSFLFYWWFHQKQTYRSLLPSHAFMDKRIS